MRELRVCAASPSHLVCLRQPPRGLLGTKPYEAPRASRPAPRRSKARRPHHPLDIDLGPALLCAQRVSHGVRQEAAAQPTVHRNRVCPPAPPSLHASTYPRCMHIRHDHASRLLMLLVTSSKRKICAAILVNAESAKRGQPCSVSRRLTMPWSPKCSWTARTPVL